MLWCGNAYIDFFYKFLFIFCLCVSLWLFFAIVIFNFCEEWTNTAYYVIVLSDTIYGVFSVIFGTWALFTDYNEEKCSGNWPYFIHFILFNIVLGLGCLMRCCVAIILYVLVNSMWWVEQREDNARRKRYTTIFKKIQFDWIDNQLFHTC